MIKIRATEHEREREKEKETKNLSCLANACWNFEENVNKRGCIILYLSVVEKEKNPSQES